MATVTEVPKSRPIEIEGFEADGDLSAMQYCVVIASAQSSGKMQVKAPTGANVQGVGVLQNTPTDAEMAEVMTEGVTPVVANTTFNAGVELAIAATTGKVEAAAAGDYVVGIALEAAAAANHIVAMKIANYQKNA